MPIHYNPHKLVLKKLSHKIRMIKSAAFIRLALLQEQISENDTIGTQGTVNQQIKKNLKQFTQSIDHFLQRNNSIRIADGFYRIKQAGWKLIAQAESQEEQDSGCSSTIISKLASVDSTYDPISKVYVQETRPNRNFDKEPISNENIDISNVSYYEKPCHKLQRMETYHTLKTNYSRTMKLKKRELILRKIQNIQLCLELLDCQTKRQLDSLYSYFRAL